jgi:adhesin transport system outer membrane protein
VLSVEQPLWTFGTLTGRIRQAQHLSEAATFNTQAARENVAVQFFDALGALMAAHQTHTAKLEHWQQHRRYQGIMQRRVDAQVAPGVDMDLLSTRMLNLDMEVQSAATAFELQINKLKQISGVELSSADAALLSQPPDLSRLKVWKEQHDVEAMAMRVDQMPAVQKTMSELDAAKNHVKAVNAQRWPTLSARYESQIQGERLPGQAKDSYWIGLNYSPGAGLSNFATATAEAYRLASAVAKLDEVKRIEAENIQAEWIKFNSAINNADLIQRAMQSSRAVHESYERQFEAGKKSWLDLLNTMRETQAQELQWIQAASTAVVAQYKLRLKAGEWIVQP